MLSRHTRRKMNTGIDERAGTLPLALPGPGDPARSGLTVAELTWTLKLDHEWLVRVAPLRAKQPSFGFLLQEADRSVRGPGRGLLLLQLQPLSPLLHCHRRCCRCHCLLLVSWYTAAAHQPWLGSAVAVFPAAGPAGCTPSAPPRWAWSPAWTTRG